MKEDIEDGVSLGELFSIIWKRKINISGITCGVILLFVLLITFVVNPMRAVYVTTFELDFYGFNISDYPSVMLVDYRDVISDENILSVIEENPKFNYIDLDDFTNDTISIKYTIYDDSQGIITPNNSFDISIEAKVFKSKEDGTDFLELLVDYGKRDIVSRFNDITSSTAIMAAEDSISFELQLSLLTEQVSVITSRFATLRNVYGDVIINGKHLSIWQQEFESYMFMNSINNIISKLSNGSYVKDYELNINSLKLRAAVVEVEIDVLETKIENLSKEREELLAMANGNFFPEIDSYNNMIISLSNSKIELDVQLVNLYKKINIGKYEDMSSADQAEYDDFVAEIEVVQSDLKVFTNEVTNFTQELFLEHFVFEIPNRDIIVVQNSIGLIITILLGGMLGGGISCVAYIAKDLNKKKEVIEEK